MLTDKMKELEVQLAEFSWYKDQYKEMEQKLLSTQWQAQSTSSEAEVQREREREREQYKTNTHLTGP